MRKKMRRAMLSLVLSVLILLGDVMYVPAIEAIPFSIGQILSGTVADGKVYYQFSLSGKKTITLDTTVNEKYDFKWEIKNSTDKSIYSVSSYHFDYNQFTGNYTCSYSTTLSGGTYYLIVESTDEPVTYSIKTSIKDAGSVSNASGASGNIRIGIKLKRKKSLQLTPLLTGMSGRITWKSSKKSVAKVSSKGKVKARKRGTAIITAKCKGKKATIEIRVY